MIYSRINQLNRSQNWNKIYRISLLIYSSWRGLYKQITLALSPLDFPALQIIRRRWEVGSRGRRHTNTISSLPFYQLIFTNHKLDKTHCCFGSSDGYVVELYYVMERSHITLPSFYTPPSVVTYYVTKLLYPSLRCHI